jgi:hypothetical protein
MTDSIVSPNCLISAAIIGAPSTIWTLGRGIAR